MIEGIVAREEKEEGDSYTSYAMREELTDVDKGGRTKRT